jgi:hypothetical protein
MDGQPPGALDASSAELPAHLTLLEEHWRLVGPSGSILTCGAYRPKGPGVEVRAGYSVDHFHCTQRVANIAVAQALAAIWRTALLSLGYVELSLGCDAGRRGTSSERGSAS